MISEDDIRDVDFYLELIKRSINEKNGASIKKLFEMQSQLFILESSSYQSTVIRKLFDIFENCPLGELTKIGQENLVGNILVVYCFLKKHRTLSNSEFDDLLILAELKSINDSVLMDFVPYVKDSKIVLDLDDRVTNRSEDELEKAIHVIEVLFKDNRILETEDSIRTILMLYEKSDSSEFKIKKRLASSLFEERVEELIQTLKMLGLKIDDANGLISSYSQVYRGLLKLGLPVYFSFENFRFNGVIFNANFFPMKFLDISGHEKLLFPFKQVDLSSVQKIFDIENNVFVTPKERIGRIKLEDVFSFTDVTKITAVNDEKIQLVKRLSENDIEDKLTEIIGETNITPHGPAEKADIFTTKVYVNNSDDVRNSAFILKGKGYPTVKLHSVSTNILKAMKIPAEIVFLVYSGNILDEAKEYFIDSCILLRKMYCIIGPNDLARLFVAYNNIEQSV